MRLSILSAPLVVGALLSSCSETNHYHFPPGAAGAGSGGVTDSGEAGDAGMAGSADGGMMGAAGELGAGGQNGGGGEAGASGASGSGGTAEAGGNGGTPEAGGNGGTAEAGGSAGSGGGSGINATEGCGKAPGQALDAWQQYSVPLSGETLGESHDHTEREIFVRLPADYDETQPYRVVYISVGCSAPDGASAAYPLWDESQGGDANAIYVALSLPDPATNLNCYDARAGLDSIEWESLDRDHAFVSEKFCIDNDKVYTGGYSSGAWLSNMYSCYFGGIPEPPRKFLPNVALRGAMAVAGCWEDGNPACNGPVGALFIHDAADSGANPYSCAVEQRDRLLAQNSCADGAAGPTAAWGEDFFNDGACLKYTACPAEYPVVFCSTTGRGHNSQNDNAIAGFTRLIQEMEAAAP